MKCPPHVKPRHWILPLLMLVMIMGLLPSLAHAQVSFWIPCSGSKARAEGRSVDIRSYLRVNTVGMQVNDIENLYCVTQVKCVALGYCQAASPEQQAAADELKREMAAEELQIQRERQAKAAEAERKRLQAEEDRKRQLAAIAAEQARREKLAAAEAKRLQLSAQNAKRLVEAREEARKKMPRQPEKCTHDYAAYTKKLDFTPVVMLQSKAMKDYAALDRSKICNGHPGTLAPLQCSQPVNFFGAKIASCTAEIHCPARQETKSCNRASAQ